MPKYDGIEGYKRAERAIGKVRCWFTRDAVIELWGCNTDRMAQDFKNRVLRHRRSRAGGTLHELFWSNDGKGTPVFMFIHRDTGVPVDRVHNKGEGVLSSKIGWKWFSPAKCIII